MGRIYSIEYENEAVLNADGDVDLFEIIPADDKPCRVWKITLGQSTELGDAAEEQLRLKVIRGHTTSGSGGPAAPTPRPLDRSGAAAGFTAEIINDVVATAGTTHDLESDTFNLRTGYLFLATPETVLEFSQADTSLVLRLMAAVADDLNMSGTMVIEEMG